LNVYDLNRFPVPAVEVGAAFPEATSFQRGHDGDRQEGSQEFIRGGLLLRHHRSSIVAFDPLLAGDCSRLYPPLIFGRVGLPVLASTLLFPFTPPDPGGSVI
jgi:hypothetical protein